MSDAQPDTAASHPAPRQPLLVEVGRPAVQTLVTSVFSMGMAFVASILAARWLGPHGNGELVLGMNLVLAATSAAGFSVAGLYGAGVAGGRLGPAWARRVNLAHAGLSVFVVWGVLEGVEWHSPAGMRSLLPWAAAPLAAILTGGMVWQSGLRALRVGTREIGRVNLQQVLMAVGLLLAWAVCALAKAGSSAFWLWWGAVSVGSTLVLCGAHGSARALEATRPGERVVLLLRQALTLHLGVVGAMLIMRLNPTLIANRLGAEAVGVYGVASAIASRMGTLAVAFGTSLVGAVGARSEEAAWGVIERVGAVFVPLLLVLGVGLALLAYPMIPILFGVAYREAALLVSVLIVGQMAYALFSALLQPYLLTVRGDVVVWPVAAWLGLAGMVPLVLIGIDNWGIVGAAAAESLAYVIAVVMSITATRVRYSRSLWSLLVPRPRTWLLLRRAAGDTLQPLLRWLRGTRM